MHEKFQLTFDKYISKFGCAVNGIFEGEYKILRDEFVYWERCRDAGLIIKSKN